jgi:transcriptional regulator with XRE-family HTH domain
MPRPPPEPDLGAAIAEARRAAGLSQAMVAEKTGLAVETLSRVERGKITPGIDALTRIAVALGVGLDELVGLKPPKATKIRALRPAERRLLEAVAGLDEADVDRAREALTTLLSIEPPLRRRSRP